MTSFNPIRRSRLDRRHRENKSSAPWRRQKIRLNASGMATLRSEAYARSEGICECHLCPNRKPCGKRVNWLDGQLHHIISRGRGGSDEIGNVAFLTRECHAEVTGMPKFNWGWLKEEKLPAPNRCIEVQLKGN